MQTMPSHTYKQTDHADKALTSTDNAGSANKMKVISDAEGNYTFNLSYHGNGANPEVYSYYVNVDFPAALGDYRIVYKDNATWSQGSAHTSSWYHPSKVIPKIKGGATEAKKDTVSFFVAKGDGITTSMKFQYISAINGTTGAVTWTDVASGSITIPDNIDKAGVYNFIVTQPVGGGSISLEKAEPYTGSYYIRTDNAGDTKWKTLETYTYDSAVDFKPTEAGDYEIRVIAYSQLSKTARKDMKLTVTKALTNTSKLGAESIKVGEKVKVRCFAEGGAGDYEFAVYYKLANEEKFTKLRGYKAYNIIMFTPSKAGTYDIRVFVRDTNGKLARKDLRLNVT